MSVVAKTWAPGETIPRRHTCEGADVSPPVDFANVPPEAQVLALIFEDADAPDGPFTHWAVWNIPRAVRGLREGEDIASLGAYVGRNGFGSAGYRGPCPPDGEEHRYDLRAFALSEPLPLRTAVPREDVEREMEGRILAVGEHTGTYRRG